jgi:hypothetical protein
MVLSIEERVFLVEGNRYTDLVQEQFAENLQCVVIAHARLMS